MKRCQWIVSLLPAALLLGSLGGCATMISGARQEVLVDSNVPGAKALTETQELRLPGHIKLPRGHPVILEVSAPGYETRSVRPRRQANPTVALNCLCGAFGFVGLVVDAISGSAYEYPRRLMVRLQPSNSYASLAAGALGGAAPGMLGEPAGLRAPVLRDSGGRRGDSPLWSLAERGAGPRPLAPGAAAPGLSAPPDQQTPGQRPAPLEEGPQGASGAATRKSKGPPLLPRLLHPAQDPRLEARQPAPLY